MIWFSPPRLAPAADGTDPGLAAWARIELGAFDQVEERLEDEPDQAITRVLAARLEAARGDFLAALARLEGASDREASRERARVLGVLGQYEDALALVEPAGEPEDRLIAAGLHLAAGEPAPASVWLLELPEAQPLDLREQRSAVERWRLRGEVELARGAPGPAIDWLRRARAWASRLGCRSEEAIACARLGEAHAAASNRWRALRTVTRGMDLTAGGQVAAAVWPPVHAAAHAVYRQYGHPALAQAALQAGHHRVLQLASGIDQRRFRETFLIDNRDCNRLIAAFKGTRSWSADIPRA